MYCPNCGAYNADNASYCSACGEHLHPATVKTADSAAHGAAGQDDDDDTYRLDPPLTVKMNQKRKKNIVPIVLLIVLGAVAIVMVVILLTRQNGKDTNSGDISIPTGNTEQTGPTVQAELTSGEAKEGFTGDAENGDTRFQDFDWLSERAVTLSDLAGLTPGDLRILRNAIYAKHGYKFKSADLQEYFGRFDWYTPMYSDVTGQLSAIEKSNLATIQKHEGKGTAGGSKASSTGGKSKLKNVSLANDYSDVVCYIYLSPSDLSGMTSGQLRILRNTIYARHGRRFKDASLQSYFNSMPWYVPTCNEVSPSALSSVEKHNIEVIQSME